MKVASAGEIRDVQPYLDYLDKEQTVQGILCTFCILAAAGIAAKIALAPSAGSGLLPGLQGKSLPYVVCSLVAFAAAALFFYLQRSELLGLHGYFVLAIARKSAPGVERADSWSYEEALAHADSYSLWNPYQCGLGALYAAGIEALLALLTAGANFLPANIAWLCSCFVVLATSIILVIIWRRRLSFDEKPEPASPRDKRRI